MRRWQRRNPALLIRLTVVAAAVAVALLPFPASQVERVYSSGIYPVLQRATTSLSNTAPFTLLDGLIAVIAAFWLALFAHDVIRGRGLLPRIAPIILRTAVWASVLYLLFMGVWGFNYRREPLIAKLGFREDAVTADAARAMAEAAVDQANLLFDPAHFQSGDARDGVNASLTTAFSRVMQSVGGTGTTVVARPKRSLLDWYFRRAAVSGMTDPFFLETLVASDVLAFERPFVVAHEWSHLAGLADESEANFVGWLTCVRGSAADRYSGWLFLYQELLPSLDRASQTAVAARLGPGPRADLRASRERLLKNVSPRVAAAGWRVYDSYLKANRVPAGAASYADVVRLVLGVQFRDNWTPILK